jgi:hypothetical protein
MIFFHEFFLMLAIAPLLLIPVEIIMPYPYIVEELVKFLIVLGLARKSKKQLMAPVLGGFLFALTETFLYIPNIINVGQPSLILKRLLVTGSMHIITMLLMYTGIRKKLIIGLLAFVLSVIIHYFFNSYCYLLEN